MDERDFVDRTNQETEMTEPVRRVRLESPSSTFGPLPVLITESKEEFKQFYDSLHDELKPRGPLERHYVADIADKAWEIRRLRRVKANLINCAMRASIIYLLQGHNDRTITSAAARRTRRSMVR
jgi:hypothetical protein